MEHFGVLYSIPRYRWALIYFYTIVRNSDGLWLFDMINNDLINILRATMCVYPYEK